MNKGKNKKPTNETRNQQTKQECKYEKKTNGKKKQTDESRVGQD